MKRRGVVLSSSMALLIGVSTQALALHAKPGEWQVTVKMDMAGLPQIPPAQLAKMRAMGIHLPVGGDAITVTHCMTPSEAAMDKIPTMAKDRQKYCSMQNLKTGPDGMSADMVCTGKVQGSGHMQVRFDSPEHYAGKVSMNVVAHGHPMSSTSMFDAKWLSADCKADH
ncbi:MAG TPA: DUF3617 domain-containing protein [Rhizomicrobium sp.]|nr:DUF3617 domain-containing protein [Rhizomicrobium sp.]